jgi:NADP-dependent 3-hydroxy acid dehydrogenase YdfG
MSRLQGQVVVLTGGGSGVGRSAAGLLVQAGASVVIAGRDPAKLEATLAEINSPERTLAVPTDVTDPVQCQNLIDAATSRFGPVSILVNNAGTNIKQRSFRDITPEAWDKMIRANLDGAFYCTKAVLPQMLEQKNGLIVNVVSVAGKRANPLGGVAYVAAKFGMGAMGLVLSNEEKDSGLRVSNIYPGEIDTPILSERPVPITEAHRATILQPGDVAEAILFVCNLPARVSIPELVIKPSTQMYW